MFIHKAMVEVCETVSTFKASNRFAEFNSIYVNGEFPALLPVHSVEEIYKKVLFLFVLHVCLRVVSVA